jgi:catechol 1,2-dioxygenase
MRKGSEGVLTKPAVPDFGEIVANPRVAEVVQPLIDEIRRSILAREITREEWGVAVAFLLEIGATGEMPLFLDAFFEATVDVSANRASSASPSAIEGPYYVPGAPMLAPPCVMPQREDEPGEPLLFTGSVKSADGGPVTALLDVWQSDGTLPGTYSNIHGDQPDFNLRGRFYTDERGQFELRTIQPVPYTIPFDGPTGRLLMALGRHPWRPAHIHVKVSAEGYRTLTTQIYFTGDQYLDSDSANAVKDELVIQVEPAGGDHPDTAVLPYDFQLQPAPTT